MRAHSDIKNILIFEKHDEFLRRPSPSSVSAPLRSESRCFFTCILLYFYPHSTARNRNTQEDDRMKTLADTVFRFSPWRLHSRRSLVVVSPDSVNLYAILTPGKLGNTHPNSTRLCWSSPPKHCLPVDAPEHVNSLKVFVKAQRNHGRVILRHIACFPRRVVWLSAAGKESGFRLPLLLF